MLLTIDNEKVRESLAATDKPAYVVRVSHLIPVEAPSVPTPSLCVGGTMVFDASIITAAAREHITSIRRKIEESGVGLKSVDELSNEIDEMRGRSK